MKKIKNYISLEKHIKHLEAYFNLYNKLGKQIPQKVYDKYCILNTIDEEEYDERYFEFHKAA